MRTQYIRELLRLTREQEAALKDEAIDRFGELMADKQIVIDQITSYNKEHSHALNEEEMSLLKEAKDVDEANNREFKRQYEEAKKKIRDIRNSRNSHDMYTNAYGGWQEEGIFFDKRQR